MSFFDKIQKSVTDFVNTAAEKSHQYAQICRFKNFIEIKEKEKIEAYISLGKYYFSEGKANEETEKYFDIIESATKQIDKTIKKIEEINACEEKEEKSTENIDIDFDTFDENEIIIEEDLLDADEEQAKEQVQENATQNDEKIPWD